MNKASLRVDIFNIKDEFIKDASVEFRPENRKVAPITIPFNDKMGCFFAKGVPAVAGELHVTHSKLAHQSRATTLNAGDQKELFILAEPGVPTYFREKVRMPVNADPDMIAVTLHRAKRKEGAAFEKSIGALALQRQKGPELAERSGVRLYRAGANSRGALKQLTEHSFVEHAGAVVSMRKGGFSHLTRDVVVRFRGPRADEIRTIAREYGYSVMRELVYAPGTWVLRWNEPASLEILDSIERLAARKDVEWAEPSLVVTPEVDAIIPTDPHWPGLWDRQLIGCQDAWQHLQDAGLSTFGDPDIVLAVWDSGVQSAGGAPTNDDFNGTVSSGEAKVLTAYDFETMVANNDAPWENHGSGVAGVAAAMANNASPVAGEAYGLAGSAPNVRIMTIIGRWPYVDIEVADQYIWMAGFDPESPIAGFPAKLDRGADVITCSLTPGAGAALSGTARATLDFVTTFGRGGKGTLCFFSTGNANQNNVTARPYGAYEKCFGIAATSIGDDGVTEIRAPYSGWGEIAVCAPSQDRIPTVHNPPTGYKPWGATHEGTGNLPSFREVQTTLSTPTTVGATSLTVASTTGIAVGAVLHIGDFGGAGSEPARVSAVNAMTNQLTVQGYNGGFAGGLLNAHAAGAVVVTGPANHRNDFGGTSSATPLCAGVGALVLSANPSLTFIEVRQILRDTAVKFDLENTDPTGQWLDADGNPSVTSGQPPVRSKWYGYGRVDAAAAVDVALSFPDTRDLVIRDNLGDSGAVASTGAFWDSPDIWCRRVDPASDPGALPANYATAGPHQAPERGHSNWVYARVRNNGTTESLDAWVRFSITHFPGMEFTWPTSFQPTNGPGDPLPSPMTPGTYFIGEAKLTSVPAGGEQIVNVEWPAGLIPPVDVVTSGGTVHWHPCLLVEVTPHDGPTPTGNHVWDDNNIAQKNITIIGTDAGSDFAMATVVGSQQNASRYLLLEINRGKLPRDVRLHVDLLDPVLRRRLHALLKEQNSLDIDVVGKIDPHAPWLDVRRRGWDFGWHEGREVLVLRPDRRVLVPILAGQGRLTPVLVGGVVGKRFLHGEFDIILIQRQPSGDVSGSASLRLRIGKI